MPSVSSVPAPSVPAPTAADPGTLERLRRDLATFTVDAVHDLLGPVAHGAMARELALPARRVCTGSDLPLATLTALFVLGAQVTRRRLDQALPRVGTDGAARLGLVEPGGADPQDPVRARVDLRPYAVQDDAGGQDAWLASDLGELATGRPLATDHVLGVGGASLTLARCTVRDQVHRVLDLGTGCGVQALHAARHSAAPVVGTDVSARALGFAAFNAALNGVRLELHQGSLLEPVAGQQFDLVVSNPPFVITPRAAGVPAYEYRDGGMAADDLVAALVGSLARVLRPGGVAQLLGNWEHRRGEPWTERVAGWLDLPDAAGLDAWVVQREVLDPAEYAETWIRDGGTTSGPAFDRLYGAWLDDLASRQVEAVGFGLVTLRRPPTGPRTLLRLEEARGGGEAALGEQVAAVLRAHDWLQGHGEQELWAHRFVLAPDVTEERYLRPGQADPSVVLIRQGGGFQRVVQAGTELAGVVGACDGELALGTIADAVSTLLDLGRDQVRRELWPQLRAMVLDGFLVSA